MVCAAKNNNHPLFPLIRLNLIKLLFSQQFFKKFSEIFSQTFVFAFETKLTILSAQYAQHIFSTLLFLTSIHSTQNTNLPATHLLQAILFPILIFSIFETFLLHFFNFQNICKKGIIDAALHSKNFP
jgi:hypothetical protein